MRAAHALDNHQDFLEAIPPRTRLRTQTQEEDHACRSDFPGIEEILQDTHFTVIGHLCPSKKPKEGFGGDGGDYDDELSEGGV